MGPGVRTDILLSLDSEVVSKGRNHVASGSLIRRRRRSARRQATAYARRRQRATCPTTGVPSRP
eukprot:11176829-Lingulodinium_polyedra.AAC.1